MSEHLPECKVIYPRDVLAPGEELPPDVPEDIGIMSCAPGCPRMQENIETARKKLAERSWSD